MHILHTIPPSSVINSGYLDSHEFCMKVKMRCQAFSHPKVIFFLTEVCVSHRVKIIMMMLKVCFIRTYVFFSLQKKIGYFKSCLWHPSSQDKQKQHTLESTRFKSRAEALLFETQSEATQTIKPVAGVKSN